MNIHQTKADKRICRHSFLTVFVAGIVMSFGKFDDEKLRSYLGVGLE